ncbi:MAG: M14 family zinc carboxypeptidase [Ignavibacteriaceae bacterium]
MKNIIFFLVLTNILFSQDFQTPLEKSAFTEVTTFKKLESYVKSLNNVSKYIEVDSVAQTVGERTINFVRISKKGFIKEKNKITLLISAQQNGDEQGAKEGALLFLKKFATRELDSLLERVSIILVPQVNPDGSEINNRNNSNQIDISRDHLLLSQHESHALHRLFFTYYPEATLDVAEYYPYTKNWEFYGYFRAPEIQYGTVTNINMMEELRALSEKGFLPYAQEYFEEKKISYDEYLIGGPPGRGRIRRSNGDINELIQNFGVMNTFSILQKGINGKELFIENIERRAKVQAEGIEAFVKFCYMNAEYILTVVNHGRGSLKDLRNPGKVALRMEHFQSEDTTLSMKVITFKDGRDTLLSVSGYYPVMKPVLEIEKPYGYLVSQSDNDIVDVLNKHGILFSEYKPAKGDIIQKYKLTGLDTVKIEDLPLVSPTFEIVEDKKLDKPEDYYLIKLNQIQSNLIALALEPRSQYGFLTYVDLGNTEPYEFYNVKRLIRKGN